MSTVDVYDPTTLPPAVQATDACFQAITDVSVDAIFQFQGQNFGDSLSLLNVTVTNGTYTGACVPCYARHTTARCKTTVSRGLVYNVTLVLAGQSSGPVVYPFPALVDTTPPFVSTADSVTSGRSELATVGGDMLVLVGTRFGANCSVTNASVGVYPLSLVSCNSTTIVGRTPAGAGVMGVVSVVVSGVSAVVGGNASVPFAYRPPAITGVLSSGALPTLGFVSAGVPSNVTLVGSNFGTAGSSLLVTFVSASDGLVRSATNCTRDPVGHAWVSCFGVVGVGVNHSWSVVVGGQASNASVQTTSFAAPQLLDISGAGSTFANTDGGQIVFIGGREFGPASSTAAVVNDGLIRVVYGPASNGSLYSATGCTISSAALSSSQLQCVTAPGIGPGLYWTVTIGGQTASTTVGPTSYSPPIITSFAGAGSLNAVTAGNQVVTIFGSNFGPMGTAVTAVYTTNKAITSVVSPVNVSASNDTVQFPATNCAVVEAHRKINCTTTEGAGFSIVWVLTIGNQTSQSPTTSYKAPTITSLRMSQVLVSDVLVAASSPVTSLTSLATEGGEVIVLNGTDLGPSANRTLVNAVSFGGGSYSYSLQNCTFLIAHQQLQCVTPAGVGSGFRAQVTVMYQSSGQSSDVLSYRAPSILVVSPSAIPTSGATVTLNGTSFGAAPEQISLFVNGVSKSLGMSLPHRSLLVRLDDVANTSTLSVQLVVGGQASNVVTVVFGAPTIDAVVEYNTTSLAPAIRAADSCFLAITDISREAIFQLQGQNFGSFPSSLSVSVANGTNVTACVPCFAQHTIARCKVTVDRGITYNVSATRAGQV
ncbi:MAG: IPT/TIG domain-containing protein, partial [Limnohabitans sp.]